MIKNIWTKIWDRIKDNHDKLEMNDFYSDEDRNPLSYWEVEKGHECSSCCCILGWGAIIAREEGMYVSISKDDSEGVAIKVFGERFWNDDMTVETDFRKLCYDTDNDDALEIIRQKAEEEGFYRAIDR